MARPTMRSVRDNIDAAAIGKTGLANDQILKRNILKRELAATSDPAIAHVLQQQDKLMANNNAAKQYSKGRRNASGKHNRPRRKVFRTPEGFNECGIDSGPSYASRAGERMEKKQADFPDVMRHPTTIHLMAVSFDGDLKLATDQCRPIMRTVFAQFTNGAQIEGMFQFVPKTAAEIAAILPASELPSFLDPINRPDEIFALLHWHGIISDPYLTKNNIRRMVRNAIPGCKRVCVASVQPERINKYGEITHGAQGYFEYSAMEKTEINFDTLQQRKEAVIGCARLSTTWNKRNRSFSMGKSLAVTGIKIDLVRIAELEAMQRLDAVKASWNKLCYAERFIHLWFSGLIGIICKPQAWLKHSSSIKERFLLALNLIKNWSIEGNAQDIDFIDYMDARLE